MPVVATNTPTIANAAANTAGKSGTFASTKDSDDKSFSDFLTEQTPDKTPDKTSDKTDTAPKTKAASEAKPAGKWVNTKSGRTSGSTKPAMSADAKAGSRKSDGVKQDQSDTQTDSTDTVPAPDAQLASNVVQQPLLLPADDQDNDSNGTGDSGNQSGQPGKDTVPAPDAAAASDASAPPQLPQINNDAMAAAASQVAAANVPPPPSAPVTAQTVATTGIDATQKGPRPRMQPAVPADATAPQTVADSDSDADSTAADAPDPGTASAVAQTPPPVTTAQNSQDDDDQDGNKDDANAPAAPAQIAASADTPAPQPAPMPLAPAVSVPSTPRAPRTVTAQNDAQTVTDTAPADPAETAPPTNQPQVAANADNAAQTPGGASQAPKPGTIDFKIASAKDGNRQTQDTSSTTDANMPAPPAPQAPQPPAPSPVMALATGIAPQTITGGGAPVVTTNVHVGPQTPDVTPNVNSLAVEIATKSQSGAKQFDIRLDPPELGRVEVRLSIDATGKAEAHMTADQPQTLHLLQKDSETLTRALRDAGLDVSQDGLNFSLRGQDRQNSNGQNNSGQGGNFRAFQATKIIEAVPTNAIAYSSTGNARLDIHV